ncbi:type II secretion system protein GspC [Myxococcus qinghaiensis]|uniref:type II secretion system protein GspC n=1 Tax=Myxococcus qinghaiensis TaxID=2906758 RepID=UPI0020A6F7FB|nr:type II secretion system protein GspC [Myxococcus qinghaiensis]MCP3168538.1 general secretion pathway protein GspC [Myxococcus qinghaiensis]
MMRTLLQKHFWLVSCAFILVAALIAARTLHLITAFQLEIPVSGLGSTPSGPIRFARTEARLELRSEPLARLLGVKERNPVVPPAAHDGPRRSARRAKLVGTLTSREPIWSLASVEDLDSRRVRSLRVGDVLQDAEVIVIERERIIVTREGQQEVIDREGPGGPPSTGTPVSASSDSGGGIRRVGEHAYEVPDTYLDLDQWTQGSALTQARIVPAFREGTPQGFKLFSIRPGSVYEKLGLQNGDILQRINGVALDSTEKALEQYMLLKKSRHLEVDIDRGGLALRKVYDLRP